MSLKSCKKKKTKNLFKLSLSFALAISVLISQVTPLFAAAFTAGMAKRDASGLFAEGVMVITI